MATLFKRMVLIPESEYLSLKKSQSFKMGKGNVNSQNIDQINARLNADYQKGSNNDQATFSHDASNMETMERGGAESNASFLDTSRFSEVQQEGNTTELKQNVRVGKEKEMDYGKEEERMDDENTSVSGTGAGAGASGSSMLEVRNDGENLFLEQLSNYFSGKELDKATAITKRVLACKNVVVDMNNNKLILDGFVVLFINYYDMLHLWMSRKKPADDGKIRGYIDFFSKNDFPMHLITNSYIRKMVLSSDVAKETESSSNSVNFDDDYDNYVDEKMATETLNRSGSTAMTPVLKYAPTTSNFRWLLGLEDVDKK